MPFKSSNKGHVFVCGLGRSGTTWISKSLGQSKELVYIKEAWLLGKFQEMVDWYHTIYNDWDTFTPWKNSKITPEFFVRQLSHFYNSLLEQVSDGQRFIEKTPEWNVLYLRLLIEMFPDAYFVLIYRDGRNYVKSSEMHRRNENLDFDFKTWCQKWALAMDGIEKIQKENSLQNYMLIRYEDLLMSFDDVFRKLCNFVEIKSFLPELIKPNSSFEDCYNVHDFNSRWKSWSESQKEIFKTYAGSQLVKWKYSESDNSW